MQSRKYIVEVITALFVLLWVYAALSKLLDYQTFKVQLGKSPLLTDFSGIAAVTVPVIELMIAAALLFKPLRLPGLYASLFMMVLFTAYIIAILNFSYYVPCSCGGILSSLGWTEHVIFNLAFVVLAILGIVFMTKNNNLKNTSIYTPSLSME